MKEEAFDFQRLFLFIASLINFRLANSYFEFKKFRVDQLGSAMKVCTDSCIFGAWIQEPDAKRILDIGTGTGLLALMMAQTHSGNIDAVEINNNSFLQAVYNVNNSPWNGRITVFHADINEFIPPEGTLYDTIICNPPFFKNHLQSLNSIKNEVLHDNLLSFEMILTCVKRLLRPGGNFYILLPPWQAMRMEKLAEKANLFSFKKMIVKERADKDPIRVLTAFSHQKCQTEADELIIRDENNAYTYHFRNFLKDFYLHL